MVYSNKQLFDAIKRHNNNQKGNIIDRNNNIAVKMNWKLFEYRNQTTAVKHAQLSMKCSLLSGHLYDLHVVDSLACKRGFDFEDINHFFFNCPLVGAERTELLTNLLTLGITNVNLSLLLIGCDDYDEELNKNIFKFVHHFIDCTGRLYCFITQVVMVYILYIYNETPSNQITYMLFGISFLGICV